MKSPTPPSNEPEKDIEVTSDLPITTEVDSEVPVAELVESVEEEPKKKFFESSADFKKMILLAVASERTQFKKLRVHAKKRFKFLDNMYSDYRRQPAQNIHNVILKEDPAFYQELLDMHEKLKEESNGK